MTDADKKAHTGSSAPVDRRSVLAGVGGLGALGALAACSGGSEGTATKPSPSLPSDASVKVPEKAVVLVSADEVPVGGGVRLLDRQIVITQPQEGQFRAFGEQCPHAGCAVAEFENNEIICPCHGSRFSADTGDVVRGPARAGLSEVSVEELDGQIITTVE